VEHVVRTRDCNAPTLTLPRFAGEGTRPAGMGRVTLKSRICSLSREAGEGWGGGGSASTTPITNYLFLKAGRRFSTKAAIPSFWSCVENSA